MKSRDTPILGETLCIYFISFPENRTKTNGFLIHILQNLRLKKKLLFYLYVTAATTTKCHIHISKSSTESHFCLKTVTYVRLTLNGLCSTFSSCFSYIIFIMAGFSGLKYTTLHLLLLKLLFILIICFSSFSPRSPRTPCFVNNLVSSAHWTTNSDINSLTLLWQLMSKLSNF